MSDGAPTRRGKIAPFQVFALLTITCLNMQDGFDILAISYSAGAIAEDWGLQPTELGVVFSASLFGMMLGAMFLAPLADKVGRRTMAATGLAVSGVAMIIAATAANPETLVLARLLTGVGIGGILASLNTLAAEYAGERFRSLAISTFQLGYPLGAFFAGYIAAWLLDIGSWRDVFWFGAFLSFLFIPILLMLPESTDFLARSRKPGALERINRIRKRFGQEALDALNVKDTPHPGLVRGVAMLFAPRYAARTALIWSAFFLLLISLYFLLSWTPQIVTMMGFGEDAGNRAGRFLNLAGLPGTIILGLLATATRPAIAAAIYLSVLTVAIFTFAMAPNEVSVVVAWFTLLGFFAHGSMIGLYTVVPTLYPTELRATGTGWAIGLSRFGAIIGPALAGYLMEAGVPIATLFQIFAFPVVIAAVCALALWRMAARDDAAAAAGAATTDAPA